MKKKTVWILVLVVLFAILLIQNSTKTDLKLYFWSLSGPLFILVFFIFLLGFLVGFLAAKNGHKKEIKTEEPVKPHVPQDLPAKPQP
jgi:uncharacterized integral membrane protein